MSHPSSPRPWLPLRGRNRGRKTERLSRWRRYLELEKLEDRLAPATRTWTGLAGITLWSSAANWDTGAPVNNDGVVIPGAAPGAEVLFDTSVAGTGVTLNSLTSDKLLRVTGDTLTLSGTGPFTLGAGLNLSGGTLTGASAVTVSAGSVVWTGGTLSGTGQL